MADAVHQSGIKTPLSSRALIRGIGAFAVLVMSWPAMLSNPTTGSDMSWVLAIAEAHAHGVRWGRDLVFPYGPLGFLVTGSATHGGQFAGAIAYRVGLIALLYASSAEVARRSSRGVLGASMVIGLAVVIGATNAPAELLIAAAFARLFVARDRIRAVVAVHGPHGDIRSVAWRSFVEASVLVGLGLVTKFSVGVALVVLAVAHLIATQLLDRGRRRAGSLIVEVAVAAVLMLVALVGWWLASGQRIGDLSEYVRRSWALSAGYVQSMWLDNHADRFGYLIAILALLVLAGVVRRWVRHSALPLGRGWVEAVVLVPTVAVVFRASFTRLDAGHTFVFTGITGLLCVPYLAASLRPPEWSVEALVLGTAAVVAVAQMGQSVSAVLDPAPRVREVLSSAERVVWPRTRSELLRSASSNFPEAADVAALLDTISGDAGMRPSVAVVPIETSMIWRFQLRWAQPPVLQRYSAYAPGLDALDGAFYRSDRAPSFILYQAGRSIDGRLVAAEAPRSLLELTCHYRPVDARGTWTLLRHLARSRCGPPSVVRTVTLHNGRPTALDLPELDAGNLLYAVTLQEPNRALAERLRTVLARPSREDTVLIDGQRRRLIASSFGAPIPFTGSAGPGDALVSGIVGDIGAIPEALSIAGPGWSTITATIAAYPAVGAADDDPVP